MATSGESPSGGHYTPAEEFEIFLNWGNELMRTDPEFAQTIIEGIVTANTPENQEPIL